MRRLSLLTAATTQTLSVQDVIDQVLTQLVGSLDATHGIVCLKEGEGKDAQLVARSSVGYEPQFLAKYSKVSASEPWAQRVLKEECQFLESQDEWDPAAQKRLDEAGLKSLVTLGLPGKNGALGILAIGTAKNKRLAPGELSYLVNMANLLGMTLENVRLFEQVATVRRQWEYTFDSIGDPILVHDGQGRILRSNQRLRQLLGREREAIVGRSVAELLPAKNAGFKVCPFCEGVAGRRQSRPLAFWIFSGVQLQICRSQRARPGHGPCFKRHHGTQASGRKISHARFQRAGRRFHFYTARPVPGLQRCLAAHVRL